MAGAQPTFAADAAQRPPHRRSAEFTRGRERRTKLRRSYLDGSYVPGSYSREATCLQCAKTFPNWRSGAMQYCSRRCAGLDRYTPEQRKSIFAERKRIQKAEKRARRRALIAKAQCAACGGAFSRRHPAHRLCSDACRKLDVANKAARDPAEALPDRECGYCGKSFKPTWGRTRFCSHGCGRKANKASSRSIRRAKLAGGSYETVRPIEIFERDKWRCQLCGVRTLKSKRGTADPRAPELDHIVPIARGGAHTYRNTQCACRACNGRKSDGPGGQLRLFG